MKSPKRLLILLAMALVVGQVGPASAQSLPSGNSAGSSIGAAQAADVSEATQATVDGKLLQQLEVTESARFVVEFKARPDVSKAAAIDDFVGRGQAVVDALQKTAKASQRAALRTVSDFGGTAEPFWFRNVMVVEGDLDLVDALSKLPEVKEIRPERIYPLVRPVERGVAVAVAAGDPEWGVAQIGADQAWETGVLGGGIVVASVDTGVDYTHPALSAQYRGNVGDGTFVHDYNWWDPSGVCGGTPCDNVEHGTHTMGTMVGGDGPGPFTPDIGVAPGAKWIAAKGCEDFGCSEQALLSSGQWILAPTDLNGQNPDPAMRPDIVNNSWGSGPGDTFYLETVQNWRAAGIIPVFASGNPGPFCGEGGSPGDYLESFSVGATDINDVIADFSGRGPSVFGKINPDVTAPGVDVASSVPGGGYAVFSGTSMAAPHVAGTLALMLSAAPNLIGDVDGATGSLAATALDIVDLTCGGADSGDPNNVYGDGRIDALAAVQLVATGGTLTGSVANSATSAPIPGANVSANNGLRNFNSIAGSDGTFKLFLGGGEYVVTATSFGFETAVASGVIIQKDQTTIQDFELTALPTFKLTGFVRRAENNRRVVDATVAPLGVPIAPVKTNKAGKYTLTMPLGTYTVEASQGGCLSRDSREVALFSNTRQNFSVVQHIDDFGHGCAPIAFEWVDATKPTTVYGDDQTGRLPLPFPFTFYDQTYQDLFIASNGYLAFEDQFLGFSDFFNTAIPNRAEPNAAIYAVWQDLWVIGDARVEYDVVTEKKEDVLVIEYANVPSVGSDAGANFEVKLRRGGSIDLLYGPGMENLLSGRNATAGIENSGGTDGLQLAFQEKVLTSNTAWRFSVVPTGHVAGVVTNLNDGEGVAGATVTALPGGRKTTTASDGSYSLRLVPGRYTVSIEAKNYETATTNIRIRNKRTTTFSPALAAARAEVIPGDISAIVELGSSTETTVEVRNTGSAPLNWEAKERDSGGTPPDLPPAPTIHVTRPVTWGPVAVPEGFGPSFRAAPTFEGSLETIIDDPIGDANGAVDIGSVSGGSDGNEISMQIDFSESTPMNQAVGVLYLDTDQNPSTGLPPEAFFGLPTQDVGMEYFIDLFSAPDGFGYLIDTNTFEFVGEIAVETIGQSYRFDVPLGLLGGDDGFIDVDMVMGDFDQPSDWAADIGHGTIQPFRDAPWMSESPENGVIAPGESTTVTVTLGGQDVDPGDYTGLLVFVTNDPRRTNHEVNVALTVALPADVGSVGGVVTNGRAGYPVPAAVTIRAERDGTPVVVTKTADDVAGEYVLYAPEGTWPIEASFDGYLTFEGEVTVVAGQAVSYDIVVAPLWPDATLEGGPLDFQTTVGGSGVLEVTLGNLGGLADLDFEVLERPLPSVALALPGSTARVSQVPTRASNVVLAQTAAQVEAIKMDGAVALVFQDALPWDSDALQQVLSANGIAFDLVGSAEMATIDMTDYEVVFVSNDQSQTFYDRYTASAARFESYVDSGGFLWFGAAGWGWNNGDPSGLVLPGGVSVDGPVFEDENVVVQADHPVMTGVPNPFSGTSASHASFSNVIEGSTIAIGAAGRTPTLVEYGVGAGRVLAIGQTLEFAWLVGQDGAVILENSVPYAVSFEPFSDVPWVSVMPAAGQVASDATQALEVTVDATGLTSGTYRAEVVVRTNDPLNRILKATVTMVVGAN